MHRPLCPANRETWHTNDFKAILHEKLQEKKPLGFADAHTHPVCMRG